MTDLQDDRLLPLASLRLYGRGQGAPYLLDRGYRWYQPLLSLENEGVISETGGAPDLEILDRVGLVCHPALRLQETRQADWEYHNEADWEERLPAAGAPRRYRLVQLNCEANLEWWARSRFVLPRDPHVAFSLVLPPPPPDHDAEAYPPMARIELGGSWAFEWSATGGGLCLQRAGGRWAPIADLPDLNPRRRTASDEALVLIRPLRGMIGLSVDLGRRYEWIGIPGGAVTIPAGRVTLRGAGGQCVFGLHQIAYRAGSFDSPRRATFTPRLLPVTSLSHLSALPAGAGLALADTSLPLQGIATWRATLTPGSRPGPPGWSCQTTPELYAVEFSYPVVRAGGAGGWSTPWEGAIEHASVEKPVDLSAASATVRVRRDGNESLELQTGRWARAELRLGHATLDGEEIWQTVLAGAVREIQAHAGESGRAWLDIAIENSSIQFRRASWAPGENGPLGGLTLNTALDRVLDSEGLQITDRLWHWVGDRILLPPGAPEDPAFQPPDGESKWETMDRLCRWGGLELGVLDDGRLATVPRDWHESLVTQTWRWQPEQRLDELVLRAHYGLDSAASLTAVILRARDQYGREMLAYAVDQEAERWPLSPRFTPWREVHQEELPGAVTPGFLALATLNRFRELSPPRQELELETPPNLALRRRQRVQVDGLPIGAAPTHEFAVIALRHEYSADPGFARLVTTARLRRIA